MASSASSFPKTARINSSLPCSRIQAAERRVVKTRSGSVRFSERSGRWIENAFLGSFLGLAVSVGAPVGGSLAEESGLKMSSPFSNLQEMREKNQQKLDEAEEAFQNSDILKELKARSEANKEANKRDLEDKYCFRQAELGIGDCGGLRYIPGMTKNGVQKRPKFLEFLFGPSEDIDDILPPLDSEELDRELAAIEKAKAETESKSEPKATAEPEVVSDPLSEKEVEAEAVPMDVKDEIVPEGIQTEALPEEAKAEAVPEVSKTEAIPEVAYAEAVPEDQ